MRSTWTGFLAFGLLVALAPGCSRESGKGGPGADKKPGTGTADNRADHFTIKVPAGNTNVTQGEKKEISITIDRDGKFEQEVKLTFKAPAGLKVEPATTTVAKDKRDTQVTVHANSDAKVGTTNIKVIGNAAGGGKAADVNLGIEVKAKS